MAGSMKDEVDGVSGNGSFQLHCSSNVTDGYWYMNAVDSCAVILALSIMPLFLGIPVV